MITVITMRELSILSKTGELEKSENFDFLNETAQDFIAEAFAEDDKEMGKIIYLKGLGGKVITAEDQEVLADEDSELLDYLPELEEPQIIVVVEKSDDVVTFTSKTMNDIELSGLTDESERELFSDILSDGADVEFEDVVYAVTTYLKMDNVTGIFYPEHLEDAVEKIKQENEERASLFQKTALFS